MFKIISDNLQDIFTEKVQEAQADGWKVVGFSASEGFFYAALVKEQPTDDADTDTTDEETAN